MPHPYHAYNSAYNPVSRQDSELQSLLEDLRDVMGNEQEVYVVTPPGSALSDSGCALSVVGRKGFNKHKAEASALGACRPDAQLEIY